MHAKWEKEDKPKEVELAAHDKLKEILTELGGPSQAMAGGPPSDLNLAVERLVLDKVKSLVDKEFEARVEAGRKAAVAATIEKDRQTVLTPWYNDAYVRLEEIVRTGLVNFLSEPWPLVCPVCNRPKTHVPTGENWSYLLTTRSVNVACDNPLCTNHIPSVITGIRVTLAGLIVRKLAGTNATTTQRSKDSPVIF